MIVTVPVHYSAGQFAFQCPICKRQILATLNEAKTQCTHSFNLRPDLREAYFEDAGTYTCGPGLAGKP